jgi:hypothetical protein
MLVPEQMHRNDGGHAASVLDVIILYMTNFPDKEGRKKVVV